MAGGKERGVSIDERMARSAVRIRAEMFEGLTSDLLITDKPWFFELTPLGAVAKGELPPWWMPRYHRISGAVYTTRWEDANLYLTEDGKRHAVFDAEQFVILRQPEHRKNVDLNVLPKSWDVQQLVPQGLKTIESALRQQDEVRYDHGFKSGPEHMRVEELFVAINQFSLMYARGEITKDSLYDKSIWIIEKLEEQGLLAARGPLWQDLREALTSAFEGHPSGKFYPLVTRMKFYRAIRDLVKLEVETLMTREKADRVFNLLFVERKDERHNLREADKGIARVGGFDGGGKDVIFKREPGEIRDEEITRVRYGLKSAAESLKNVRVEPYLIIAKLAEAMLGSEQFRSGWERKHLQEILTVRGFEYILRQDSFDDLLMKRKPEDAHRRLHQIHSLINEVLSDPDNDEITVFD
jgi:hypothetical protein